MPRVYFDVQVFDRIAKGEIPVDIVKALRPQITCGKIRAYLSVANIDEMLGEWPSDRAASVRKLEVARDLVGFDLMLKQPRDLLIDAIRAYTVGCPTPSPLATRRQRRDVADYLHQIVNGDGNARPTVRQILEEAKSAREAFLQAMRRAREHTRLEFERRFPAAAARRQITFVQLWRSSAEKLALQFADEIGLGSDCRRRGTAALLDIRPLRFATGALLALIYAQIVGDGVQSRQPQISDGYDLYHALMASAADVFVTYDKRLADALDLLRLSDFRVVRSLDALLA